MSRWPRGHGWFTTDASRLTTTPQDLRSLRHDALSNLFMFQPDFRVIHDPGSDTAVDVVWVHHAGGTTATLVRCFNALENWPEVRLRTPWMPAREQWSDMRYDGSLRKFARQLADTVQAERAEQRTQVPLVMIGHSFGSVIAYRMALELLADGIPVHRLVVMSFPSPENLTHEKQLDKLDDQQLMDQISRQFGGMPADVRDNPEAQTYFVPAMRFDVGLLAGYEHEDQGQAIDVPITAICGTDDSAVELPEMHGWQQMTNQAFRLRSMPGDHFFPLERMDDVLRAALWDVVPG